MTATLFTAYDIIALSPCHRWPAARVREMAGAGVTAVQIAERTDIDIADRRWVLCHLLARGPRPDRKRLVRWAVHQALRVVDRIPGADGEAAHDALTMVLLWTAGDADDAEMRAAREVLVRVRSAAYAAAAYAAAAYAAYAAADAAYAAADAAYAAYAADAAAADAAADAAYAAAYAAYAAADADAAASRKQYASRALCELARIIDTRLAGEVRL